MLTAAPSKTDVSRRSRAASKRAARRSSASASAAATRARAALEHPPAGSLSIDSGPAPA
jgi:hypothetical protein